tara:strand:+ start:1085 stop:1330 length:246 start_codon:yes stop_codon:yes gene_type:complete
MKYPLPIIDLVEEDKMLTEKDMQDYFAITQMARIMDNKMRKQKFLKTQKGARHLKINRLDYQLQNKLLHQKFYHICQLVKL